MTSHSEPLKLVPRVYQTKAIEEIRSLYSSGKKRVLLQLSTGGGKTATFAYMLDAALKRGTRSIMVVKGRSLVMQASDRLSSYGIDHSVFMAGNSRYDPSKLIQIASVDTCRSRGTYPDADFVVIDEAHTATSKSFKDFLENYEHAFWLPVTATPWTSCGLIDLAEAVVFPISFEELIEQGFLVPPKYFCPSNFDTSKIKMVKGEFEDGSSIQAFSDQKIYGDILGTYDKYCKDSVTWVFAINVSHAEEIKKFFEENGVGSVIITGDTPLDYRKILLEREKLVISIGTLTTGVDLPKLANIIMCRPTASRNLYVQMLGRGTRPHEGKDHFKVFDHVGNYERFGDIRYDKKHDLKPLIKKKSKDKFAAEAPFKICESCKAVQPAGVRVCRECDTEFDYDRHEVKSSAIEMSELSPDLRASIERRAQYHLLVAWAYASKPGVIWYRLKEEFSEERLKPHNDIAWKYQNIYREWEANPHMANRPKGWKKFNAQF